MMVGVLPATISLISPAGAEKGRPLLATVKTLKKGTAETQGTEKSMSTLRIGLFWFFRGKRNPISIMQSGN